jgi:hypothetical protein
LLRWAHNKLTQIQRDIAAGLFAQARNDLTGFEDLVRAQRGADLRSHLP